MKKCMCFLGVAQLATMAWAADLAYTPQGDGPYLWSDAAAWGTAAPTAADDVTLDASFTAANPLTIPAGTSAAANSLNIKTKDAATSSTFFMDILGGLSFTAGTTDSFWGVASYSTNVINVAPGATMATAALCLGRGRGANVCVTNAGTWTSGKFEVGYGYGADAVFHNFGTFTMNNLLVVGRGVNEDKNTHTKGTLYIHEGSTFEKTAVTAGGKNVFCDVGMNGTGEVIVEGDWKTVDSETVYLGYSNGGKGTITIQGNGRFNPDFKGTRMVIGNNDQDCVGRLVMRDNGVALLSHSACFLTCAGQEGSVAYLDLADNASITGKNSGATFSTGKSSHTEMELKDHAYFYCPSSTSWATGEGSYASIKLSGSAQFTDTATGPLMGSGTSTVRVEVADSAILKTTHQIKVMASAGSTGSSTLTLKGGTVTLRPELYTEGNGVFVGTTGADAEVRGHGLFTYHTWVIGNALTEKRIFAYLHGRIVADGFGEEHDLDTTVLTPWNDAVTPNADSGWYAANKGRLFYPHPDTITNGVVTIGECHTNETLHLVNALRVKITGMKNENYGWVKAALYAPDRSDLPAALPVASDEKALGIWRLGYVSYDTSGSTRLQFQSKKTGTAIECSSADVKIRHTTDFGRLAKFTHIIAYRYDATSSKWVEVSNTSFNANDPSVTFTGLPIDGSEAERYSIGWVALVARQRIGTTILIR